MSLRVDTNTDRVSYAGAPTGDVCAMAWINASSLGTQYDAVYWSGDATAGANAYDASAMLVFGNPANNMEFWGKDSTAARIGPFTPNGVGSFATNTWYHVAVNYNTANGGTCEVFVDGISRGTGTMGSAAAFQTERTEWGNDANSDNHPTVSIFNPKIWNRKLTATEIQAEMLQQMPVDATSIWSAAQFDNDTTGLVDLSGNGRDYTETGTLTVDNLPDPSIPLTLATTDQEGFRFGEDDGSESAHTWTDAQDTNITAPTGTKLLRVLVDAADDPSSAAYTLRAQKNGSGGYAPVALGATTPEIFGTVTFGAIGTGANGSTTVAPSYPASITAGQYLVLVVTSGGTGDPTPTTPSGWTFLATGASTDGTFGVDAGPRRVTVFGREADGTETGTVTVSITSGNTCRGTISRFTRSGSGSWVVEAQGANDSTSGTGFSATGASMNWNTGDVAIVAVGQRVDTVTQSAQSLTATGVTFGTRTNRANTAVTTGNDHRHVVDTFAAITSTSDVDAAPTWAFTGSAACSGGVVFVRLREYTAAVNNEVYVSASANIAGGGEATTARLTAPSGKSTSDFVTGRRWDDENGTDTIDITTDDYTEVEWAITMAGSLSNGDYFDFRVYSGNTALDTYGVTPRWTIGSGSSATADSSPLDAADQLTGSMSVAVAMSSSPRDSNDGVSSGATLSVSVSGSPLDLADALSAGGTLPVAITGAPQDQNDGLAASGGAPAATGDAALRDQSDLEESTASLAVTMAGSLGDARENLAAATTLAIAVGSAILDGPDTLSAAIAAAVSASATVLDRPDLSAGAGTIAVSMSTGVTDSTDFMQSLAGAVSTVMDGTLRDANDGAAGSMLVTVTAAGTLQDQVDRLAAAATLPIAAVGSLADQPDRLAGAASLAVSATTSVVDVGDGLLATVSIVSEVTMGAALREQDLQLTASAALSIAAAVTLRDRADLLNAGSVLVVVEMVGGFVAELIIPARVFMLEQGREQNVFPLTLGTRNFNLTK